MLLSLIKYCHTPTVCDFHNWLSSMDKSSRQKVNKELLALTGVIMILKHLQNISCKHKRSIPSFQHFMYFSKMDHILRHRTVSMQKEKSNYVLHNIRQWWIEAGCQQLQDACKPMKTGQFTTEWKWVKREIKKKDFLAF